MLTATGLQVDLRTVEPRQFGAACQYFTGSKAHNIAVRKLAEAATKPANHRYSLSRGLPKLREAIAGYYQKTWGVELDTELEITNTIGSKEGFSHLMWVLLDRGDEGRAACLRIQHLEAPVARNEIAQPRAHDRAFVRDHDPGARIARRCWR